MLNPNLGLRKSEIRNPKSETLRLNGSDIKRVKKTKSLGVIVDEGLNWEEQFKTVKGKFMEVLHL